MFRRGRADTSLAFCNRHSQAQFAQHMFYIIATTQLTPMHRTPVTDTRALCAGCPSGCVEVDGASWNSEVSAFIQQFRALFAN